MIWKFKHRTLGGHVHVRVFSAAALGGTFEKSGDLVFRVVEWAEFRALIQRGTFLGTVIVEREEEL